MAGGLQIGVVGAGVAGLSAAIALRRIGHDVEVSPTPRQGGATDLELQSIRLTSG